MTTQRARFQKFIEPHIVALRRAAYRLCRNVADADDLVQDVCLRVFEKSSELDCVKSPRAWLLRVEFNLHVDATRRRARAATESLDDPGTALTETVGGGRCPESDADTALQVAALNRVWPALTPDQQALLALYAEGYSLKELTDIMGLPLSALKARLHRARVRLGKLLTAADSSKAMAVSTGETA